MSKGTDIGTITSERKKHLIDIIAKWIVDHDLGFPSELVMDLYKPMAFTLSQGGLLVLGPILSLYPELDEISFELVSLLGREENWKLIVNRVKELKAERMSSGGFTSKREESILGRIKRILFWD